MCDFRFIDFTPDEIIKIMEQDIKQYQRKYDYHTGIANSYKIKMEDLEVKVGKLQQKIRKENKDWFKKHL